MYIITAKQNNVICGIGEKLDYIENGYPRLVNEDVAFPPEMFDVKHVNEVPAEVKTTKYCYTAEKGFFLNSDWEEPNNTYGIPNSRWLKMQSDIQQDYRNQIVSEVNGNA